MTQLWERQQGESDKAFSAFCVYRDLPPKERTLLRAYEVHSGRNRKDISKKQAQPPGYFKQWCDKYEWFNRATAYDDYLDFQQREATREAKIQYRKDLVEAQQRVSKMLVEKAELMLKFPLLEQEINGKVIKPPKWTFAQAALLFKASVDASKLLFTDDDNIAIDGNLDDDIEKLLEQLNDS